MSATKLYRSKSDRRIAGVCGGLAEYFNTDPLLVRILFFVFALCASAGFWVYLIMWVFVPEK